MMFFNFSAIHIITAFDIHWFLFDYAIPLYSLNSSWSPSTFLLTLTLELCALVNNWFYFGYLYNPAVSTTPTLVFLYIRKLFKKIIFNLFNRFSSSWSSPLYTEEKQTKTYKQILFLILVYIKSKLINRCTRSIKNYFRWPLIFFKTFFCFHFQNFIISELIYMFFSWNENTN